jgi:hypothetical protein
MTLEDFLRTFAVSLPAGTLWTFGAAFLAGVVSSAICPCTLPVGIGIAGVAGAVESRKPRAGFLVAASFFAGIVLNLAILGALAGRLGAFLRVLRYVLGFGNGRHFPVGGIRRFSWDRHRHRTACGHAEAGASLGVLLWVRIQPGHVRCTASSFPDRSNSSGQTRIWAPAVRCLRSRPRPAFSPRGGFRRDIDPVVAHGIVAACPANRQRTRPARGEHLLREGVSGTALGGGRGQGISIDSKREKAFDSPPGWKVYSIINEGRCKPCHERE